MSASLDFRAMAQECIREALIAGRLPYVPDEEDIKLVARVLREARKQQARTSVMTDVAIR